MIRIFLCNKFGLTSRPLLELPHLEMTAFLASNIALREMLPLITCHSLFTAASSIIYPAFRLREKH